MEDENHPSIYFFIYFHRPKVVLRGEKGPDAHWIVSFSYLHISKTNTDVNIDVVEYGMEQMLL
jgi:hypothetical protein